MADTATGTPVTLAEIRQFLNITESADTGQDALLITLCDRLTVVIENYIGLSIINKAYTEYYDGDGSETLLVKRYPIVSVTSLTVGTTLESASDYHLYSEEGYIVGDGFAFPADNRNVTLVYTAGFGAAKANVPEAIKLALLLWASYIWKKDNVSYSQNFGESFIVNVVHERIPADVAAMLVPYRVLRFGSV